MQRYRRWWIVAADDPTFVLDRRTVPSGLCPRALCAALRDTTQLPPLWRGRSTKTAPQGPPPCRWATVSADRRRAALRTARCLPHGGGCNVDDGGISLVDEASGCEDVDTIAAASSAAAQSSAWRVSWCDAGGGWGTAGGRAPPGGRAARSRLTPLTSDWQRLKWRNTGPSMGFSSRPHRRAGPEGVPVLPGLHAHLWGPTGSAA